jgi:hypothetical protein
MGRLLALANHIPDDRDTDSPQPDNSDVSAVDEVSQRRELEEERNRIQQTILYGEYKVSPESLILESLTGKTDFLDLYSYHGAAINPKVREYRVDNPDGKIVCVGTEFREGGDKWRETYMVNYDAVSYMKRATDKSVQTVNIDHHFQSSRVAPALLRPESIHIQEASRILADGGQLMMIVDNCIKRDQLKEIAASAGFSKVVFLPFTEYYRRNEFSRKKTYPVVISR